MLLQQSSCRPVAFPERSRCGTGTMTFERLSLIVVAAGIILAGVLWLILFRPPDGLNRPDPASLSGAAWLELDRAIDAVDPADKEADSLARVCLLYYRYGLPSAAAACYGKAATWEPGSTQWIFHEGAAHQEAGELGQAVAAFERVLEMDPLHHGALLRLGYLLLEDEHDRSVELFRRAVAIEPEDPRGHYGLGVAMRVGGDHDEALRYFQRAVELAPHHAQAHYAIAMILAGGGQVEAARDHLVLHAGGRMHPLTDETLRNTIAYQERIESR